MAAQSLSVTIGKAPAPASVTKPLNIANSLAKTYNFAFSNLRLEVAGPSGTRNTLSLPILFNNVAATGEVGTVTVTVSSDNYEDYTGIIQIIASNKTAVDFSGVASVETPCTGQPVKGYTGELVITGSPAAIYDGDSFTLTSSGGSGTGSVTWEIVSGPATVDASGKVTVTGTGEIQIKATKAADTEYTQAEATITLNAAARPTPSPTKYLVTVNGGTGGGNYEEGETVTITATIPDGQRFTGWTVNAGGITLDNASNATTTFTMPAQAVTVTANFQSNSGDGSGTYTPPTYPSAAERPNGGGGAAEISPSYPKPGDTVIVKPRPNNGYEVDEITVTDRDGKPVEVDAKPDGTYTFRQPTDQVRIEVAYKPVQPVETPWNNPFTDVSEGDWYSEAVRFVQKQGLMSGYSDGRFGPNDNLSRAQLAQILFNKEGRPVGKDLPDFSDVADEVWYAEAIRWAASQGIVGGYGNGRFGPNDPIGTARSGPVLAD